ncbi:very short patch repair endonuclease [uncultured Sphingomonas sp.]|uniref:very short patch repair endonuclease n=1 Tax=uncultured Sphingomonas sp. TaxID=158754 RepID=UPI0025EF0414|nr:very short patch repair endonuclease [uncultured Sphingomonas sp.]
MDNIDPKRRSANMARIRGKDTAPEMQVRRIAHRMGLRFRLHRKDLPGKPDLVFPKHRLAVFVHGCFWHRHPGCARASSPSTRVDFWAAKFAANVARDARQQEELGRLGWNVLVVWQCDLKDQGAVATVLKSATEISP